MDAFDIPETKRFQRFITLAEEDFVFPADRTDRYVIIEVHCFAGRSDQAKRQLLTLLMSRVAGALDAPVAAVEVVLFESPAANWAIRGQLGHELTDLPYRVDL